MPHDATPPASDEHAMPPQEGDQSAQEATEDGATLEDMQKELADAQAALEAAKAERDGQLKEAVAELLGDVPEEFRAAIADLNPAQQFKALRGFLKAASHDLTNRKSPGAQRPTTPPHRAPSVSNYEQALAAMEKK